MGEVRYMISEAAKKVQVESHVLRYWEEELGLEIGRTDMGHRYYTEDDIQLFLCIQKLKNEGMLLRDLKPMIPELTATRKRLNAARSEKAARSAAKSPGCAGTAPSEPDAVSDKKDGAPGQPDTPPGKSNMISGRAATAPDKSNVISGNANAVPGNAAAPGQPDPMSARETKSGTTQNPLAAASSGESSVSTGLTASGTEVIQMTQLEQVRSLIGDVLTDVVSANNETLKKDISRKVTADVIREMDFLFQANERREEEHYRKLDMLIRQQQAHRRETMKETPIGKLKKLLT